MHLWEGCIQAAQILLLPEAASEHLIFIAFIETIRLERYDYYCSGSNTFFDIAPSHRLCATPLIKFSIIFSKNGKGLDNTVWQSSAS